MRKWVRRAVLQILGVCTSSFDKTRLDQLRTEYPAMKAYTMSTFVFCVLLFHYTKVNSLATDVRISHGPNSDGVEFKSYEGAIEVLVNGTWGPVIRHGVDSITAKTICKLLGHGFTGFVVERFTFTGVPLLQSLSCVGSETSITQCTQTPLSFRGEKYDAPGVHCFAHVFDELRLTDGEGPNNGTVNIKMDGRWGLLCGYPTGNRFATPNVDLVICKTFGYQTTLDRAPRFGQYVDVYISWLDVDKISCTGDETNLNQCTISKGTLHQQPRCSNIRGVNCITRLHAFCSSDDICAAITNAVCSDNICKCKNGYFQTGEYTCTGISQLIRLDTFSEHEKEGFLQVNIDDSWIYIAEGYKTFTTTTSKMICQALGFGHTGFSSWLYSYDFVVAQKMFECNGTENSLEECISLDEYPQTNYGYGVPVATLHCWDLWINDVRLTGGQTSYSGSLEVKIGDRWGPVCGVTRFTVPDAALQRSVICQSLWNAGNGYLNAIFSSNNTIPWMSSLTCEFTHKDINQCSYVLGPPLGLGNTCSAYTTGPLHVTCQPIQLMDGPSKHTGRVEVGFYRRHYTICAEQMNIAIANVICNVLGYSGGSNIYNASEFGKGQLDIFQESIECFGNETSLDQCYISNTTDELCPSGNVGGVGCLAYVGQFCSVVGNYSVCDSIPHAECNTGRCGCKPGYSKNNWGNCEAIHDFRLMPLDNNLYEGIVEVKVEDTCLVLSGNYTSFDNQTASILCQTFGISTYGFSTTSSQEVDLEKNMTVVEYFIVCYGHELHATECDLNTWNDRNVSMLEVGWTKLHCPNCDKGFYGPNCTQCDCHGHGIGVCDAFTGICTCKPGWQDDTCSTDINECLTNNETCPESFVCVNQPGYFICECNPGYKPNGSLCEACDAVYFGRNCSQVCDCEINHVHPTITNRTCDSVTGNCACKSDWTGSRCDIVSISGTTDTQMMIIIISSASAGCLLLVVIVTVCLCKYRHRATNGSSTSSKDRDEALKAGKSGHNEYAMTMTTVEGTDYNTIEDCTAGIDINTDMGYDLHPDLLERTERSNGRSNEDDGYDSAGYLKPAGQLNTNTGLDYAYANNRLETDEAGYLKIESEKRQLPDVPSDEERKTHNQYEGLKGHRHEEHEYSKVNK